jgi:hypothetical protein
MAHFSRVILALIRIALARRAREAARATQRVLFASEAD